MRIGLLACACVSLLLAACADTTAITKFAQTAPSDADMQSAAGNYDNALRNAVDFDVLGNFDAGQTQKIQAQRDGEVKLIVANAAAISQYMTELGTLAGLDTSVSAQANSDLKNGLSAIQKDGDITAPEVAAAAALTNFVGTLIKTGVQQHALHQVIGQENGDFQVAVQREIIILKNFHIANAAENVKLGQLGFITDSLKAKMDDCQRAAAKKGTASRFPGEGCPQAYAAYFTYRAWYNQQSAQIQANDGTVSKLITAFTNIGEAHQKLYDYRDDLLTKATWAAVKPNVEQAQAAFAATKSL